MPSGVSLRISVHLCDFPGKIIFLDVDSFDNIQSVKDKIQDDVGILISGT